MSSLRTVKARLQITCEVVIDDSIIKKINEQYPEVIDDEEAANQLLYALINPRLPENSELKTLNQFWDGVCSLEGRFTNLNVTSD
ncbi:MULTISPECIES: hypothetical protein [Paenibacillus]|uniref:Uncharacterized protein n=1 Tax=Paenibacillus odorifer TaxID=189426 RepID=A0ABX3GFV6_9BACL|nr:hypothetical protein [Paenibacillus odorifer]OMD13442.1 hypothetical protein BSO21_28115 [Paenibacillus odorifer]